MTIAQIVFDEAFRQLTGNDPFPWQEALYERFVAGSRDDMPTCCDIPTGLGKTNVIAIWLIALANHPDKMPRRLVYVVNRRTVVDQTTVEVEKLRDNLAKIGAPFSELAISTLRGQFADNKDWSANPSRPAVICGTVDMIGSRLLFSGYRIGYKSKPLHAGFLGQDALLVHDEAHLEPAFQKLVEKIQKEQREGERAEDLPWPKLRVMALSATARKKTDGPMPFTLTDEERNVPDAIPDPPTKPIHHVWRRLKATKTLVLTPIEDEKNKLADKLLKLAKKHSDSGQAVLVFARTVENVGKIAKKLPKDATEQLTGTLRGLKRDQLVETPVFQRFLPKSNRSKDGETAKGTVYLVCTSAGEVGVNISADHMVCDLSTFDSMAQRFGRVNRFGDCNDTRIDVVHPSSFEKTDAKGKTTISKFDERRQKTLELLEQLNGDASPHALDQLDAKARADAFAPEPKILPATDILFDAWSLTTIRDKMPGRPPVEPYLHGVTEWEKPQTQVAWREEVGLITGDLLDRYPPADLLEAYPLKPHELLRDRSDQVFRDFEAIAKRHPELPAWLVEERGSVTTLTLKELADKKKKDQINGKTVLLPPLVGGLHKGLLNGTSEDADDVADKWFDEKEKQRRVRVWDDDEDFDKKTYGMRKVFHITLPGPEDDEDVQGRCRHWYVRPRSADSAGWSNAGPPITWQHHTDDVVTRATGIVKGLKLPSELQQAIILAAKFHDLGKKRKLWQRSIGHQLPENPQPEDWLAKSGSNKKLPGFRTDYRHEFGSLLDILDPKQQHLAKFNKLSDDKQELVLHLIAAHHGRARPHFTQDETIDLERDQLQVDEQALETPRRFARLQRKYGRWGLAYLESLLRAADWAASNKPSSLENNTVEGNS